VTANLAAALLAAADGILPDAAAAGLLIGSGAFLHRPDFAPFIETAAGTGSGIPMAWIDWDDAVTALDDGRLPVSSGEKALLRLTASLARGTLVSLRDTVTSLDRDNARHLTTAIRKAAGHR
jgi:hypothetical protein